MKRVNVQARRWASVCIGALLGLQAGAGNSLSAAIDRATAMAKQPLVATPQQQAPRIEMIWAPDRFVPIPGEPGLARVLGHWERRVTEREYYVPPQVIFHSDGRVSATPAGIQGPLDQR